MLANNITRLAWHPPDYQYLNSASHTGSGIEAQLDESGQFMTGTPGGG